jgi:2-dehydro-3-deoxyphosphogluconate aldolase / (4S)-4-hydroxy-2-oxoglutarate aldolase
MEVTLDQPTSLEALRRLVAHAPEDMHVGAGTVMTVEQLDAATDAGATFLVCPHLDLQLVERAADRNVDILPGVTSSTEVATALTAGVTTLKLFPAGPLGPAYLRAMHGPFPSAAFVPTGGIRVEQVPAWLEAGALAVGLGSDLIGPNGVHEAVRELLELPR